METDHAPAAGIPHRWDRGYTQGFNTGLWCSILGSTLCVAAFSLFILPRILMGYDALEITIPPISLLQRYYLPASVVLLLATGSSGLITWKWGDSRLATLFIICGLLLTGAWSVFTLVSLFLPLLSGLHGIN